MTLDESKQQLVEILTAGADAAGGEWDHKFDVVPSSCAGSAGQRYALYSFGPGSGDPEAAAARVKAVWEETPSEPTSACRTIESLAGLLVVPVLAYAVSVRSCSSRPRERSRTPVMLA